jgi:cold shock CspA family protein
MGRSQETFSKKEVRIKKEKKRKEKEKKRLEKKEGKNGSSFDDMIAYVDEFGNITSTPPDLSQRKVINAEDIEIGVPKSIAPDTNETIRKGIVTFFNDSKGFGFIKDSSTQEDVFVHINGLVEPIKENNKVIFEVVKGLKGPNAVNVKIDRE